MCVCVCVCVCVYVCVCARVCITGEYTSDKLQALKQETFAFSAKASSSARQDTGMFRRDVQICVLVRVCACVCTVVSGHYAARSSISCT